MTLTLLVLLVLFLDNVLLVDLELVLVGLVGLVGDRGSHLGHVKYFEHGVEVEVIEVEALQDNLRDDEVDVLLL